MTCRELREYLFAFLDNELDAALSMDVQRHLEHCCHCAREAEIERAIRKKLAQTLEQDAEPVVLDEAKLIRSLTHPATKDSSRRPRRGTRIALAAATVVLACAGAFVAWNHVQPRKSVSAEMLVEDFEHFLARGKPVQIASGDRAEVSEWIRREMNMPAKLPVMHGKCKLLGARKCVLAGQPAALALYDMEGAPASLLVLAGGQPGMRAAQSPVTEHVRGHTVVAREHQGLTYAAVGKVSEAQLKELVMVEE
jgi:anti-sigma factor RsiW